MKLILCFLILLSSCNPESNGTVPADEPTADEIDALWAAKEREECLDCQQRFELHADACRVYCKLHKAQLVRARSGGCVCQNPSGYAFDSSWDYTHCTLLGPKCSPVRYP